MMAVTANVGIFCVERLELFLYKNVLQYDRLGSKHGATARPGVRPRTYAEEQGLRAHLVAEEGVGVPHEGALLDGAPEEAEGGVVVPREGEAVREHREGRGREPGGREGASRGADQPPTPTGTLSTNHAILMEKNGRHLSLWGTTLLRSGREAFQSDLSCSWKGFR